VHVTQKTTVLKNAFQMCED